MSAVAKKILLEYWGYSSFRPLQEEIIDSILQKNDTLALLPTGGGKSVCFQIPALVNKGMCLVISPLIALMKDQVGQLKNRKIPAKAIYTGMYFSEIDSVLNNAIYGKLKFLYVSPERLMNQDFQHALAEININLIAVDEAHCISQWGYDFRPPYLKIAKLREYLHGVPVLALTATATTDVVEDIQQKLHFKQHNVFKASFERKNLAYSVYRESDKTYRILQVLSNEKGSAIVYVRNRRKTRELAEILVKNKIGATFYHAGLNAAQRDERQKEWTKSRIQIIVATNAFGMGIDKPDVRQVIHYNLPSDIESYFQEAGRAGRDGKESVASLLFNNNDIAYARKKLEESFPELKIIRNVYNALGNFFKLPEGAGKDVGFEFKLNDFANTFNMPLLTVYNSIKFLEREGYFVYDESAGHFSKLKINVNNVDIYRFIVENSKFERLLKELLRSYAGIFTDYVNINEKQIARRSGISLEKVFQKLVYLSKLKLITYIPIKANPQIFYNTERLPATHITLSNENYRNLKEAATRRLNALVAFLTNDKECRSLQLLRYFGEKKNIRCGVCDVCHKINETELNDKEFDSIKVQVNRQLSQKPLHLYELIPRINNFSEKKVLAVIQWLIDNGSLLRNKNETLSCDEQLDLEL